MPGSKKLLGPLEVPERQVPALSRVIEAIKVVKIGQHSTLHGAIKFLELTIKLVGGLNGPFGWSLSVSRLSFS